MAGRSPADRGRMGVRRPWPVRDRLSVGRRMGSDEGERRRQQRTGSRRGTPDGRVMGRRPGHGRQRDGMGQRLARAIHRSERPLIRPVRPRAPSRSRRGAGGAATCSSRGPPTATTRIRRPTATSTSASGSSPPRRRSGSPDGPPASGRRVPRPGDAHRIGALRGSLPASRGRHGLTPPGRHEARRQVGQRREHEQPPRRVAMRDLEQTRGPRRIHLGVDRARLRRPLEGEPGATEHQQVEVQLARAPAPARTTSEVALQVLEPGRGAGGPQPPGPGRPARRGRPPRCGSRADPARPTGP